MLTLAVALVNVGPGRVGIGPVCVYVGSKEAAPALEIDAGGQVYAELKEAGI